MIDTQPINNIKSPKAAGNPFWLKLSAAVLGAIVLGGTVWALWFMLSPTRTIELPEGQSYDYAGYNIAAQRITDQFCPGTSDIDCRQWLYEDGVQLSYRLAQGDGTNFVYLGLRSKPTLDLPGLTVEFKAVNFDKRAAKLRLTKK